MRILVVEDDTELNAFIKTALTREAFVVDSVFHGKEALVRALETDYDAIVLDIMLPGMDGQTILKNLRKSGRTTPVLMLTSQGQERDKLTAFRGGADDYLVKPFLVTELVARIQAIVRRSQAVITAKDNPTVLEAGDLRLDLLKRRLERKGQTIELTKKEFELLEYFMRRPGEVLSRSVLGQHVWGMDYDSGSNVITVTINRLLDKISEPKYPRIENIRGMGYRFQP